MSVSMLIRNIPDAINDAILAQLPQKISRGYRGGREKWVLDVICIHALGPRYALSVFELWQCALRIATWQRSEEDIQLHEDVRLKLLKQVGSFDSAHTAWKYTGGAYVDVLVELADITYYNVQDYLHDRDIRRFLSALEEFSQRAEVSLDLAFQVALIKYRLRAQCRESKNKAAERAAITSFLQATKLVPKTLDNDIIL